MEGTCSACHVSIRQTDYFCYNCGKNLHQKPPSLAPIDQALLYLGSILLPPMGFFWAFPYVRQADKQSKIVGYVAMTLTVISLIFTLQATMILIATVNTQLNSQLQNMGGF